MTCNSDSAWNSHLIGQKHRKVYAESFLSPDLNCRVVRCLASKQACAEKHGFPLADGRKRRKTFFSHMAGSMDWSAWEVSGHVRSSRFTLLLSSDFA